MFVLCIDDEQCISLASSAERSKIRQSEAHLDVVVDTIDRNNVFAVTNYTWSTIKGCVLTEDDTLRS